MGSHRSASRVELVLVLWFALSACAPALPALTHGSVTPPGALDTGVGSSARLVVAGPRPDPSRPADAQPIEVTQGVVPLALARLGVAAGWDAALIIVGTTARLAAHRQFVLHEGLTQRAFIVGVAPYGGSSPSANVVSSHLGLDLVATYSLDYGRLYEVWFGPRLGVGGAWSERSDGQRPTTTRAWVLRPGAVVGLSVGVSPIHVFMEVAVAYEHFFLRRDGVPDSRGAVVMTPTAGVRLRLGPL